LHLKNENFETVEKLFTENASKTQKKGTFSKLFSWVGVISNFCPYL
jgi:hypothetical protein